MPHHGEGPDPSATRRTPSWALIVAPLLATAVANADVLALLLADPGSWIGRLRVGLMATLPLSLVAGLWTYRLLLRSQQEVDRRAAAEAGLRSALKDRERALVEREQALQREHVLRRELDHRVRNNLAGLMGLVDLYEQSGRPSAQLAQGLRGKIGALREVYRVIERAGDDSIELHELLRSVFEGLVEPGHAMITVDGVRVDLTSGEASALAMIAQELVTNSLKYGALGMPDGAVRVQWTARPVDQCTELTLGGVESPVRAGGGGGVGGVGGVPGEPSGGVGLPLIEGFARTDLRGSVRFSHTSDRWSVELRASLKTALPHSSEVPTYQEVCT